MAEQFTDQGGVATSNPSRLMRWLTSRIITRVISDAAFQKRHARAEKRRAATSSPHVVEYFHQVEDGYSHLAAQALPALAARYDIKLVCHLVSGPSGKNAPEPDLLLRLSRYDAFHVAPHYSLSFPRHDSNPDAALVESAVAILAAQDDQAFVSCAGQAGEALWQDDAQALSALAQRVGSAHSADTARRIEEGNARREELKHYSSGMFHYGGEWYWGVDRLYHLEQRLTDLGVSREPAAPLLMPRPPLETGPARDDGSLTLEIFPSLRSPYTAVAFDATRYLAQQVGVQLVVRPVLPMVMRGVPATRQKGMYIFTDTAREARAAGIPFGHFYDPIGAPAKQAYSLYPWACEQGRGEDLVSAFLACAFAEGVNTNSLSGMRKVVEKAGLNWQEASRHLGDTAWEPLLEENRQAMYASGLWGVPSFRLLDERGEQLLALWGQDRLWLVSREIQRILAART